MSKLINSSYSLANKVHVPRNSKHTKMSKTRSVFEETTARNEDKTKITIIMIGGRYAK